MAAARETTSEIRQLEMFGQTSCSLYEWMQRAVRIGQGRVIEGPGVQHNVYRVD